MNDNREGKYSTGMASSKAGFFSSLYWKISITFLAILLVLSVVYLYIAAFTAEMYFQEASQKLNAEIAPHIASENQCFINGKANEKALQSIFHNVMVINPNIEVYLLDTKGNILTYYAPNKTINLKRVPLEPVREFIKNRGQSFTLGIDPKNEHAEKVFSASEVFENGRLMGYIYVILGGEEYENASQLVLGSYIMRLGLRSMSITLIAAALISFIALGFITKNIRRVTSVIREFKNGDLSARIKLKGKSELNEFAVSFNEMADTIVRNMEEMKTMDNLRRELVANVSHDLRTPLATIQGYLETILIKTDSLSEDEKQRYIHTIHSSAERLKKLVEELFELSKLEARETKPKPEPFSIAELAQDVHQKNFILAQAKKIELTAKFPFNLPMVYADIGMIERVLQNLLENAIKFTPEGGNILLKIQPIDETVQVIVKDSGYGISKEDLPHIFDRYNKSEKKESASGGLGLGLAIVKKILEVHNISLSVESKVGEGTTFTFNLPVYKISRPTEKQVQVKV
jgi:signal transduction histidine kinase